MAEETAAPETAKKTQKRGPRSPSFPFINLKAAVERAQAIHDAEPQFIAPYEVVARHWGYSTKSSAARQTVAALKAYGLLEKKGGKLKLTDLGLDITMKGSPNRAAGLRTAALNPDEFSKLREAYGTNLPSDDSLGYDLKREHGFNPNAVGDFIRIYKDTVAFAKLDESVSLPEVAEPTPGPPAQTDGGTMQLQREPGTPPAPTAPASHGAPSAMATDVPPVTFPLPRGNAVEIRLKSKVTSDEFKQLRQIFELLGPSVIEDH